MSKQKPAAPSGPKFHSMSEQVPDFADFFADDTSGLSCLTNDDIQSMGGRWRYQHALEPADVRSDQVEVNDFPARWFWVFRVESRDDKGEVTGAHFRCVFMDQGGLTYETHSDGAVDTLRGWIALMGWEPWEPPVTFRLLKRKGASGRTYHQLRTVLDLRGENGEAVDTGKPAEQPEPSESKESE